MANYDQKSWLQKIISDALIDPFGGEVYPKQEGGTQEQYQIAKSDYEAFRKKYSVKK